MQKQTITIKKNRKTTCNQQEQHDSRSAWHGRGVKPEHICRQKQKTKQKRTPPSMETNNPRNRPLFRKPYQTTIESAMSLLGRETGEVQFVAKKRHKLRVTSRSEKHAQPASVSQRLPSNITFSYVFIRQRDRGGTICSQNQPQIAALAQKPCAAGEATISQAQTYGRNGLTAHGTFL